jgi:hypothetical protein
MDQVPVHLSPTAPYSEIDTTSSGAVERTAPAAVQGASYNIANDPALSSSAPASSSAWRSHDARFRGEDRWRPHDRRSGWLGTAPPHALVLPRCRSVLIAKAGRSGRAFGSARAFPGSARFGLGPC